MDGWIGGWGRGWPAARRQPDPRAEAAPRARPRGCFGLQTLPFPSSPASVPSPRSPSTRSHPPAYHIPTNTHTMDNASTQDNQKHNLTIIQCWLSTQPREPFFEKMLRACRHHKRYFQWVKRKSETPFIDVIHLILCTQEKFCKRGKTSPQYAQNKTH